MPYTKLRRISLRLRRSPSSSSYVYSRCVSHATYTRTDQPSVGAILVIPTGSSNPVRLSSRGVVSISITMWISCGRREGGSAFSWGDPRQSDGEFQPCMSTTTRILCDQHWSNPRHSDSKFQVAANIFGSTLGVEYLVYVKRNDELEWHSLVLANYSVLWPSWE